MTEARESSSTTPPGTGRRKRRAGRRRRKIAWELVTCGYSGHALVGVDAAELREGDDLFVRETRPGAPVRWHRCLRCDAWVPLPAPESPSTRYPPEREQITLPLRGKALRDKIVLRLIAIDRIVHFLILGSLGIAVLAFAGNERALRSTYYRVLADLQGGVAGGPIQTSHVGILNELDKLFSLRTAALHELAIALLAYAAMEGVEAVGLWLVKRWAEYLTFIATAVLLPLEVYEIIHGGTVLKVVGFLINLAVVVYLLFAKRLFGLRGGGAADEAERERDTGWDAVERATPASAIPA